MPDSVERLWGREALLERAQSPSTEAAVADLNNIVKESKILRKYEEFDEYENMILESDDYPLLQRTLLMYTCAWKGEKTMFLDGKFALARCPPKKEWRISTPWTDPQNWRLKGWGWAQRSVGDDNPAGFENGHPRPRKIPTSSLT
jgi:hypothetical protein